MLFYTSDFLTGVALLTMAERGQYITLLCLQQQHGHMTAQQMRGAVGRLSAAVMEKFERDADGKYFNRRAELEIKKREAYAQKQRENVSKRWARPAPAEDIPEENHGSHGGITVVDTTVIPLENENLKLNIKSNQEAEILPARAREGDGKNDPELGRFMTELMEHVGTLSRGAADEALAYYRTYGPALCLHAVDVTTANGARAWSYTRAVLDRWAASGLKTLEAVEAEEKARAEREKGGKHGTHSADPAKPAKRFNIRADNADAGAVAPSA